MKILITSSNDLLGVYPNCYITTIAKHSEMSQVTYYRYKQEVENKKTHLKFFIKKVCNTLPPLVLHVN